MMYLKMTEKIKIVPDTNVIISSIFWRGTPYKVMKNGFERKYVIVTSPEIIDEVVDKLRNKFNVPENKVSKLIRTLIEFSVVIAPIERIDVVKDDSDDNKIVECAIEAYADYIVSGDKHLLNIGNFEEIKILTPGEFIELFE